MMGRSIIVTVNALAPKIGTSISIQVSPTSGNIPFGVSVQGTLRDSAGNSLVGKNIVLYINGTYNDTRTTQGGATAGLYGFSVLITAVGTYQFQTEFAGDVDYEGCSEHNGTLAIQPIQPNILLPIAIGLTILASSVILYYQKR